MDNYTITFNESVKGWTSFHTFYPDWMLGMNNQFFTFKNGELFLHDSDEVDRNEFYGVHHPSKISVMVNTSPSDIKELKAVSLEGNSSWNAIISAYVSDVEDATFSSISEVEFIKKEGIWYAYARRNEDSKQLDSKSSYGIGRVSSIENSIITVIGFSDFITSGDNLVKDDLTIVGTIISSRQIDNVTSEMVVSPITNLSIGDFVLGMKNARIEGGNLRGYTMRVDLETNKTTKVELFAVNTEVMKSFS